MLLYQGKVHQGKRSLGKIFVTKQKFINTFWKFCQENFCHLSKILSLFPDEVFPNKVFWAWEKDDMKSEA